MKKTASFVMISLILLSTSFVFMPIGKTHSGDTLSAWAFKVPTIDGVISSGEWDDAAKVTVTLVWQSSESHSATIYEKNDALYLYLAVKVLGDDFNAQDGVFFDFDNDHDGVHEQGDDWLYVLAWTTGLGLAEDGYYNASVKTLMSDADNQGTNDIVGGASHTNIGGIGDYTFELGHPLDSTDNAHDFSLKLDDTVGVLMAFDDAYHGGAYGSSWPTFGQFADIVIANSQGSDSGILPSTPWSLDTILLIFGIIASISGAGLSGVYVCYEKWKTKGLRLTERGKKSYHKGNLVKAAECYAKASLVNMKRKSKTADASIRQYAKLARIIICQGTLKGDNSLLEAINNMQNALKSNTLLARSRYASQISQIDFLLEKTRNNDLDFIINMAIDEEAIQEPLNKVISKKHEMELKDIATQLGDTLEATRGLLEKSIEKHKIEGFLTLDKHKFISKHHLARVLSERIEEDNSKNNQCHAASKRNEVG